MPIELIKLINNLKKSHIELLEYLSEFDNMNDETTKIISKNYPYAKSFDEIDIKSWGK